ncbi:MAG TPA: STAS domain-containing protein [Thermoleophilaceae bacterium]|jgi:anti-anti-sigma factor
MPSSDFTLERHSYEGVTLLLAGGDIDMTASREFGRRLEAALRAAPGDVLLDLDGVIYLDSTALRALLHARKLAEEGSAGLALVCSNRSVLHVLDVTGLTEIFDVHGDRAAALAAIGAADRPNR